jgi:hypothetical protein
MSRNDDWYGLGNNKSSQDDWYGFGNNNSEKPTSEWGNPDLIPMDADVRELMSDDQGLNAWLDGGTPVKVTKRQDVTNQYDLWGSGGYALNKRPSKRKRYVWLGVALVVLVVLLLVVKKWIAPSSVHLTGKQTSTYELQNVNNDIQTANVNNLNKYITTSYLGQEWAYFNGNRARQKFYQRVMSTVRLDVPNETGLKTSIPVKVTHVDWNKIMNDSRDFNFKQIQTMYHDKGIKKTDYDFHNELTDLFCNYIVGLKDLPLTTDTVTLKMKYTKLKDNQYAWNLTDDSPIDKLLFSSDEFHNALDVFGGIATGDIGTLKTNPNWVAWNNMHKKLTNQLKQEKKNLEEYNKIVTNNNGTVIYKDKNGNERVINLNTNGVAENVNQTNSNNNQTDTKATRAEDYTIKAPVVKNPQLNVVNAIENELQVMESNQPLKTFIKPKQIVNPNWVAWSKLSKKDKKNVKEPVKMMNVELKAGVLIPYKWIGAYYLQHEYKENGKLKVVKPEVGDGTFKNPLGFNTPVITKMLGTDGKYHDVRVALTKMHVGQKAIDYAESMDERNRGFDTSSDLQLMTIEFTVENLENKAVTLNSEFTLADSDGNIVPRTGTIYGFKIRLNIQPHQTAMMQDWFYATDLNSRYLTWGKSFKRQYPIQWFRVLHGENPQRK